MVKTYRSTLHMLYNIQQSATQDRHNNHLYSAWLPYQYMSKMADFAILTWYTARPGRRKIDHHYHHFVHQSVQLNANVTESYEIQQAARTGTSPTMLAARDRHNKLKFRHSV